MADLHNGDAEPMVHKMLNCDPTSLNKPERPTTYMYNVGAGKSAVVDHVKRRLSCVWRISTSWIIQNQIDLAFSLIALLALTHNLIPDAKPHTVKFFTLSYYDALSGRYRHGKDDIFVVMVLIVVFTGLRAACMKYLLVPLAKMSGIRGKKTLTRFSEQSWLLCYYGIFWTIGMSIYYNSPYWLNMDALWSNWPTRDLTGLVKFYILAQCAFWLQQIVIIHIEERRKDHWQMLAHHFVTIGLIFSCYTYHLTQVGNLVLVTMDFIDIILPLAKCLKYMGFKTLCDIMFGVFLVSWLLTRHIAYSLICWSIYADIPRIIGETCWTGPGGDLRGPLPIPDGYEYLLEPFLEPEGLVCFGSTAKWLFLVPLLMLQVLNFVWLAMIARVARRVIRREGAEDSRSDDEGQGEKEE